MGCMEVSWEKHTSSKKKNKMNNLKHQKQNKIFALFPVEGAINITITLTSPTVEL